MKKDSMLQQDGSLGWRVLVCSKYADFLINHPRLLSKAGIDRAIAKIEFFQLN
jgi:hypothetical protein